MGGSPLIERATQKASELFDCKFRKSLSIQFSWRDEILDMLRKGFVEARYQSLDRFS
jgi:hypothetical protein